MFSWWLGDSEKFSQQMDSMVRGNIGSSPWSLSMMTESIQIAISFGFYLPVMGICCCSVAKSCLTLCNQADCSTPGSSVLRYLPELAQIHVHWVCSAIHPHALLFLPSIFLSIRVFSNELGLCIRWPKYWSFSFSISPSSEYSGLISFRIDWFDLLVVQGTLQSLL